MSTYYIYLYFVYSYLDVTTPLIIGKLFPNYLTANISNNILSSPYIGCIKNVIVNNQYLDFAVPLLQEGLSTGCQYTDQNCNDNTCSNSGLCVGYWEGFDCICTSHYKGDTCDQGNYYIIIKPSFYISFYSF